VHSEFIESAPIMIPNELKGMAKFLFDPSNTPAFPHCDGKPIDLSVG